MKRPIVVAFVAGALVHLVTDVLVDGARLVDILNPGGPFKRALVAGASTAAIVYALRTYGR